METNLEKAKRLLKDNAAIRGTTIPENGFLFKMLELAATPDGSDSIAKLIPILNSYFYPTNPPTNSDEMFIKRMQIIEILNKLKK